MNLNAPTSQKEKQGNSTNNKNNNNVSISLINSLGGNVAAASNTGSPNKCFF
jgi:hypothetical protein